jgi:outer membrane protein OmpA-like peptidoglycan-associated protein
MWRQSVTTTLALFTATACGAAVGPAPERNGRTEAAATHAPERTSAGAPSREALEGDLRETRAALARVRHQLDLRALEARREACAEREQALARALSAGREAEGRLGEVRRALTEVQDTLSATGEALAQQGQLVDSQVWELRTRLEELSRQEAELAVRAAGVEELEEQLTRARGASAEAAQALEEHLTRQPALRAEARRLERRAAVVQEALHARIESEREAVLALRRLHRDGTLIEADGRFVVRLPEDALFGPTGALSSMALVPLRTVAAALRVAPDAAVVVEAHSDGLGSREHALRVTQQQADAVRRFLTEHGVPGAQVQAVGRGLEAPRSAGDTREGRARNGRVEIVIEPPDRAIIARWIDGNETPA